MLVAFLNEEGIVHREFVPTRTSVTAALYVEVLTRFRQSVNRKRPQKWKIDWALHHDNALSHTAMAVQQFLAKNNIPIVSYPPYSPDLAPSDFWLFATLKMGLRGRRFATVEDMKENADARLRAIKKEDFYQCYNNRIDKWNKYVCVCVCACVCVCVRVCAD
jgi:transposase